MSWIKEHIVVGVIGTAFVGVAVTWLTGLFNKILPSPSVTFIWTIEVLRDIRRIRPSPNKFLILVARLDNDPEGTHTRAVARAFQGQQGVERTQTARVLARSDIGSDAESRAVATGRRWLGRRNADLLIWGEVVQKEKLLALWFTSNDETSDFQQSGFPLDANLLGQSFTEAAREQLISLALSAIKPATEQSERYLRDILRPVADRLRTLLSVSSQFTPRQRSDLRFALGVTLCALAHEDSRDAGLEDAVTLLRSSLEDIDRRREPLAWANAQHYLGIALAEFGHESMDTPRIENAVSAFGAALDDDRETVCLLSGRKLKIP
jgi:hypothetical protein